MNSDQLSCNENIKWQRMHNLIHQNDFQIINFSWQFKKLWLNRLLNENLFILLLQYIGLMLSGTFTPSAIAPLWFASGTACGFIFMRGFSILPGIIIGCFLAYLSTVNFSQALICASLNALQAILLLKLSYRFNIPTVIFYKNENFVKFFSLCAIVTAMISYLLLEVLSTSHYALEPHLVLSEHYFQNFLRWWLGNLTGIFVFSCGIVTLDFYFSQIDHFNHINKSIFYLLLTLLIINCGLLFLNQSPFLIMMLTIFTIPVILSFSVAFGWCGLTVALFIFGTLLNLGAYIQLPLFTSSFAEATLSFSQFSLIIVIFIGYPIAISKQR